MIFVDENEKPIYGWDYKTGSAQLTDYRIEQMLRLSGLEIRIEQLVVLYMRWVEEREDTQ